MNSRPAIATAALLMAAAVALGAFGAHALKTRLAPESLAVWQTGVSYQAWHGLALLFVGVLMRESARPPWRWAARAFVAGIVLFSGSLYLLALGAPSWVGAVTPFGGAAFIAGWLMVAVGALRSSVSEM